MHHRLGAGELNVHGKPFLRFKMNTTLCQTTSRPSLTSIAQSRVSRVLQQVRRGMQLATPIVLAIALTLAWWAPIYAVRQLRPAQGVNATDMVDEWVTTLGGLPTDLASTPDGRLLIVLQGGQLATFATPSSC